MNFFKFLFSKTFVINSIIAFIILLIIYFTVIYSLNSYTHHEEKISVPDFTELTFKDAQELAQQNQLKILNAHPDLADKAKIGSLTVDSKKEQSNAGLDQCTEKEFNEFKNLNDKYKKSLVSLLFMLLKVNQK